MTNSLTDAPYPSGRRHSVRGWQWRWRLLDDDDDDDNDNNDNDNDDDNDDENDNGCTALRIRGTERSSTKCCCDRCARIMHGNDDENGAAEMYAAISTMLARQSCRVTVGAATAVEAVLH